MSKSSVSKKVAFVQLDSPPSNWYPKGNWYSSYCADAADGLQEMGYEVKGFMASDLPKLGLTKKTVVKATVGITRKALALVGAQQPRNIDIPKELEKFANRKIWATTLGEVKQSKKPVFVKPLYHQKAFGGRVFYPMDKGCYLHTVLKDFPDSFPLLAQQRVRFVGYECRAYVLNGNLLCGGNESFSPNSRDFIPGGKEFCQSIIQAFTSQPASYSIDFGMMQHKSHGRKELALVEVNDGFSCANFSLNNKTYAQMIEARWREMVKQAA